LTAKPGTDNIRDPTVVELINRIVRLGIKVRAYNLGIDIQQNEVNIPNLEVCDSIYSAVISADRIILLTNWPDFRQTNWYLIRELVSSNYLVVIDTRNYLDQSVTEPAKFIYKHL